MHAEKLCFKRTDRPRSFVQNEEPLLKPNDLQMIYRSFVRSKMEYGMLNYRYMSAVALTRQTHAFGMARLDRPRVRTIIQYIAEGT